LRAFASTERWPLTNRGLFLALQKEEKEEYDRHLLDAFFMTSHFSMVEMLFSRSEQPVGREELLKVLLEGNWAQLADFVEQQKKAQDLSQTRRQNFLLDYVNHKSRAAAQLMLKTDGVFVARKLDDKQVMLLLQLLEEKSPQAKRFALTLLKSPRSDDVRKLAADRLQEYTGVDMSEAYQRQTGLKRVAAVSKSISIDKPVREVEARSVVTVSVAATPAVKAVSKPLPVITTTPLAANKPSVNKPVINKPVVKAKSIAEQSPPVAMKKLTPAALKKDFYYVVQEGDSLWKIGRRFGVDIEVIRAFNQLESDVLHPGRSLRIPTQK
jgi:LysM repeat protein